MEKPPALDGEKPHRLWGGAPPSQGRRWGAAPQKSAHPGVTQRELQGSAPWHRAGLWDSERHSQKGTGGSCLFRRQHRGVRKAMHVYPAAICPKGLLRASQHAYQLQTFICLRAARPPSGDPTPAPIPAAAVQVSSGCCCWRVLMKVPAARGHGSHHCHNTGTMVVCGAVLLKHVGPGTRGPAGCWLLAPSRGLAAVLFSTLQGKA